MTIPRFTPVADHALLVSFADTFSDAALSQVAKLDHALATAAPPGMIETVPAFVNLLVSFDPLLTDHDTLTETVQTLLSGASLAPRPVSTRTVQVCYEDPFCPDLLSVARVTGLSPEAVINAHLAGDYRVVMYGFAPGYAYLGGVDPAIRVPRKTTPVRDIPAGSVLIAGAQCLVSTLLMPTGWSIIGRSPTSILLNDPARPFLFDVGDAVQFERIDLAAFEGLTRGATDV